MSEHTPLTEAEAKGCTCGPNGTWAECAAELAAGGWCPRASEVRARAAALRPKHGTSTATADTPVVVDLDDPYFDGQALPEVLASYPDHVHSTKGVCVKAPGGRFCGTPDAHRATADTGLRERVEALCDHEMHWRRSGVVGLVRLNDLRAALDATAAPTTFNLDGLTESGGTFTAAPTTEETTP